MLVSWSGIYYTKRSDQVLHWLQDNYFVKS